MEISEYKLLSPKISGEIIFTYHGGVLFSLVFKCKPLNIAQLSWLCNMLPDAYNDSPEGVKLGGILLTRITPAPVLNKVDMFCEYYRRYIKGADGHPVEYRKSKKDHLILRNFEVTEKLLITYFTSDNVCFKKHHSVTNYTRFYQVLCAEAAGAYTNEKPVFPNSYNKEFEKKLQGSQISEYWAHLRSLGYKAKKHADGSILDWIPDAQSDATKDT